jgi:hypothetical protein
VSLSKNEKKGTWSLKAFSFLYQKRGQAMQTNMTQEVEEGNAEEGNSANSYRNIKILSSKRK